MEKDAVLGCILIACALGFIAYLTLWSSKTIEFIARKKSSTTREILKELNDRDKNSDIV